MDDLLCYLDAARTFATAGGRTSLTWFRAPNLHVERKADESPVTAADRSVEESIRRMIRSRFPDHSIVGEEYGETIGNERYQWIIDPIDGTKSFVRGVPLYTTLVALAIDGEPVVGVIYCPPTGESVAAATGFGAWNERGDRVSTRKTFALQEAWTLITDPSDFVRREGEWAAALIRESASVRTWADAYGYMLVARGDADVMIDPVMSAWDIAPLGVIVRESGGLFTELDGSNTAIGGSALAAGTHELHETVLQMRRATEDER